MSSETELSQKDLTTINQVGNVAGARVSVHGFTSLEAAVRKPASLATKLSRVQVPPQPGLPFLNQSLQQDEAIRNGSR